MALIDAAPSMHQRRVILACTMIWPGTPIPLEHVTRTARSVLEAARSSGIASLVWPLLGAGGGRVRPELSFRAMHEGITAFRSEYGYDPDITIVERDLHKYRELETCFGKVAVH